MSCDENKEARARDRARRSLPIVADDGSVRSAEAASRPWRSLDERAGSAAIALAAVNEFPAGASELEGVSRRSFMQLVGSSAALVTVGAACTKPNEKIIPFVRRPPEVTPGNALHFATAVALDGYASGLLVESHEGRPTKIEGNPDHPETLGSSSVFEQAMIAGLYDNDRAKQLRSKGQPVAWRPLVAELAAHAEALSKNKGAGLRFLVQPTASPLLTDLRRRILERFPQAKFVSYASLADDGGAEGTKLAFGKPMVARHRLDKAKVIVALDADFLGEGPEHKRLMREFSARREPGPEMNRLYVAEPAVTITGGMADHRARVRGSEIVAVAAALARQLGAQVPALGAVGQLAPAAVKGLDPRWVAAVAADLARNRGTSIVIAGRRQPAAVHALAAALNVALGNEGATVSYAAPLMPDASSGAGALGALVEDIAAGTVDTLVITAYNPVFTAPADFKMGPLLARVPHIIYTSLYEDETAAVATTFIPAAHPLESWGDARALDGTTSIVQPLIAPLWGGIAETEVLATFLEDVAGMTAHEQVQKLWEKQGGSAEGFDGTWEKWLADGIVPGTAAAAETAPPVKTDAIVGAAALLLSRKADDNGGLEIAFRGDPKVYDGRFANSAWLQELPDPITKLTWDNAVLISEANARAMDLESGDVVEIESRGRKIEGPIMIAPGHAADAITLALGYGRFKGADGHPLRHADSAEKVARGVGFNAGLLRESSAPWFDRGAKLTKVRSGYKLAITQEHWSMTPYDQKEKPPRPAVTAPLAEVQNENSEVNQELEQRRGPLPVIHTPVDYSGQQYKWAMAIDLTKCTGCNACTVACQAENNIPTVGKENVYKSREMHWIRIDRYFEGSVEDPKMVSQPVPCMHCETAPCEYVCPVNATVHSDEGLNDMAYNRCIGTRYCSNNCPYKVRRFNFLDYTSETPSSRRLGMNPDVTVRSRGVMEKCTYCVQRIERKRIDTRIEGRSITDGELQTACQQTCPAQAITFGSLNDAGSKVSRLHADARRYDLLHELGTRPRTAYLMRVRNPNPELASAELERGASREGEVK